jgi:hypothetical protein
MAPKSLRGIRAAMAKVSFICPLPFGLYINKPTPSQLIELALYADDSAIVATSRKPTQLLSYLESYIQILPRCMSEWRMFINVSRSTSKISVRDGRRLVQPQTVMLFGEPIKWVDTSLYMELTQDTRLTWSPHIDQARKKAVQWNSMFGYILNRRSDLIIRNGVLLYKQLIRPLMDCACPHGRPLPAPTAGGCNCCDLSVFT